MDPTRPNIEPFSAEELEAGEPDRSPETPSPLPSGDADEAQRGGDEDAAA